MKQMTPLPHIVIVGAGFGGLRAARALKNQPVRVTLLDRRNYHLFQPLLYQVATAGLSTDEIAYPVRAILRKQKNITFRLVDVQRVDLPGKRLLTDSGEISYDGLILAVGGETNFFGMDSVERNGFGLKDIHEAVAIRNHILRQFERAAQENDADLRRELLTFVVVGGGPSGVESAGALSELIRLVLTKDYPGLDFTEVRVLLLEATQRLVPALPDDLALATLEALQCKRVEVRFGVTVTGYDGRLVSLKDTEPLAARTLIWAAGIRAAGLAAGLDTAHGTQRRVQVEPSLQLSGNSDVYVIGDAAQFIGVDGAPLPMIAPVAMQQAEHAVRNLLAGLRGQAPTLFVYKDMGVMATIGRNQAVARLGRFHFRGFLAWLIWLGVHIMQLIGFRNRLVVLINWAYDYVFYERAVRLIGPGAGCEEKEAKG